ncbi:MAG: hypothetical protein U9Q83_00505 [Bacteroidota bacterium]|nr:hypothetical protein [Bacteroidota bacterium]
MEKQFDIKESFIVKLKQNLDEQDEKLSPKDKKFFNLSILMDLGRFSQKYSYDCDKCKSNKDVLHSLSTTMSDKINTLEGRREITKNIDQITTHLRKEHKLFIRRYVSSLYSISAILIGLIIGIIVGFILNEMKISILIGGGVGLFMGNIIGGIKERILIKKGQVYGKY